MKIKFWGVRGSYPTPQSKFMEYGGNTACVEININDKNQLLLHHEPLLAEV